MYNAWHPFRDDIYRYDIINLLIQRYGFGRYLEIGVNTGDTFSKIQCPEKTSVDPIQLGFTTHVMTSDEFFNQLPTHTVYDIIFIDGMHEYHQCYNDIINATKHLSPGGFILCHDMNPPAEWHTRPFDEFVVDQKLWNGDVYKSFVKFRMEHPNYSSCMLHDRDWGVGVITRGIGQHIPAFNVDDMCFADWCHNKNMLMNCIGTQTFIEKFIYN